MRELHRRIAAKRTIKQITLECVPVSVSIDKAISTGVILSELIANASKYAYPGDSNGDVRVTCEDRDDEWVVLAVEDDGVGLGNGSPAGTGLGSQVMAARAHILSGEIAFVPRARAARAELSFPVKS